MASVTQMIARGVELSQKYTEAELKVALGNALSTNDNAERLVLQYALKQKTGEANGYQFTQEQLDKQHIKLI